MSQLIQTEQLIFLSLWRKNKIKGYHYNKYLYVLDTINLKSIDLF